MDNLNPQYVDFGEDYTNYPNGAHNDADNNEMATDEDAMERKKVIRIYSSSDFKSNLREWLQGIEGHEDSE